MNPPAEGPEHNTNTLSPISPKPLHFPTPSNIALLEHQMDPNYDGTTTSQSQEALQRLNGHTWDKSLENGSSHEMQSGGNLSSSASNTQDALPVQADPQLYTMNKDLNASSTPILQHEPSTMEQTFVPSQSATQPMPATLSTVGSLLDDQSNEPLTQISSSAKDTPAPSNSFATITGDVDVQALLDGIVAPSNMSTAPSASNISVTATQLTENLASEPTSHTDISLATTVGDEPSLPTANIASLPPRPPLQIPPNYDPNSDHSLPIKIESQNDYRELNASSNPSFAPLANAAPPPLPTAGAPGVQGASSVSLPPPPVPIYEQLPSLIPGMSTTGKSPPTPNIKQEESLVSRLGDDVKRGVEDDENSPWTREIQRWYDSFLEAERGYVQEGNWERFPVGSRLFLGNLPSEKVTKRDLFHVFHKYGKLAQISIKQAYGFVQYLYAADCTRAMEGEQGVRVRGKTIHLEISVPGGKRRHQRNEGRSSRNRRSRSPVGSRNGGRNSRSDNHYRARSPDRGRTRNDRLDFRQPHSPPQPLGPIAGGIPGDDASLPLPYRPRHAIPDVQVIATDQVESNFVKYLEQAFGQRGLRVDCLYLGTLHESLVTKRQMIEGVLAVMKVNRLSQAMQRYQLTVFDRSQGGGNVRYDDYQQQELSIIVELVNRAKQMARPTSPMVQGALPSVRTPQQQQHLPYQYQSHPPQPAALQAAPLSHFPSSSLPLAGGGAAVNDQSLQNILDSLNKQPPAVTSTSTFSMPPTLTQNFLLQPPGNSPSAAQDLSQILQAVSRSSAGQIPTQTSSPAQSWQQGNQIGPAQQASSGTAAPDMSQILAQLNQYGRK